MNHRITKRFVSMSFVFLAACSIGSHVVCEAKDVIRVNADDIPESVEIIGNLGQPLGSLLIIRGQWIDGNRKDPGLIFRVEKVNRKELKKPIELFYFKPFRGFDKGRDAQPGEDWTWRFDWHGKKPAPKPTDKEVWEMMGAETGEMTDYFSKEVLEQTERKNDVSQQPTSHMRKFFTTFNYISIKIIEKNSGE